MKKKTAYILYCISLVILIPLTLDLFIHNQLSKGYLIIFLMILSTRGLIKIVKSNK